MSGSLTGALIFDIVYYVKGLTDLNKAFASVYTRQIFVICICFSFLHFIIIVRSFVGVFLCSCFIRHDVPCVWRHIQRKLDMMERKKETLMTHVLLLKFQFIYSKE